MEAIRREWQSFFSASDASLLHALFATGESQVEPGLSDADDGREKERETREGLKGQAAVRRICFDPSVVDRNEEEVRS